MKKSKFGNLNFDSVEKLSREELKKVTGGYLGDTGDGTPWGFNVRYTIQCGCTNYINQYVQWSVSDVEYSGCCSASAARSVCIQNYPGPTHCVTLDVTTC